VPQKVPGAHDDSLEKQALDDSVKNYPIKLAKSPVRTIFE
jgi:hypothetical protein